LHGFFNLLLYSISINKFKNLINFTKKLSYYCFCCFLFSKNDIQNVKVIYNEENDDYLFENIDDVEIDKNNEKKNLMK
jgi:hypothetical protein